ncbi:hypothetical protein PF005_g17649 [Phytophthora fragariae]|uniref:Condensation domain-containing protein n=1 Tax=Phytophthora fragariae TaxID=53985 RepID=A0A6A3X0V7_9STRA|nr:hypothetical protein PF003_g11221 [Phytophthora fragariae]KAE8930579.1 hypothetical protein PF009_g19337 [Phytophthora fragariae]KAE8994261.1 hypothetical protein PF011_g16793 [Phytophthora fragariae]KAE9093863.1 hypothetical protein PF007_g17970 [Phytophthora fragariae]KAE9095062.1 hypothetical protein PF010_g16857 [Phytophthora fragariae]
MAHPTFPLYGYERFFAMDPGASAKLAHVATLRGDIPGLLKHLPQAVFHAFNRHPKMRAAILPGSVPQKVMICPPLADMSELKSLLTVHECSPDEEERAEQARIDAANDNVPTSSPVAIPQLRWMEFVQSECEKPLDREKDFPFYLYVHVDNSTKTFARLILFADHYMSDPTSGAVILREILETAAKLSAATPMEFPGELPLRESLYESTHYVNAWMNVVHEAVSKYVMQPLMNFDTNSFVPLLPVQAETQLDFAGSPPNPPNQSFALFAQGSEASMRSAMARCKEEQVTLQGALIAATTMAFGLTKHGGSLRQCTEPMQLRMDVLGDMRKQVTLNTVKRGLFDGLLQHSDSNESELPVGLYSTPAHLVFTSSEGVDPHEMSFWDVARKADHEWECALLGHELKMQSMFVNEVLNAENSADSGLCVANCALSDVTLSYLDCSDATALPFPNELALGNNNVTVEDLHVYNSHPSLSSTSKVFVTALSHFNYALMYKLEPDIAQQLFGWLVRCTERIGEYREHDTFAQAADRLASGAATVVPIDGTSMAQTSEIAIDPATGTAVGSAAKAAVDVGSDEGAASEAGNHQDVEC